MAKTSQKARKRALMNHYVNQVYLWRQQDTMTGQCHENVNYRRAVPEHLKRYIYEEAIYNRHLWHLITISYFKASDGALYRELGYALAPKPVSISRREVKPLIDATIHHAEYSANPHHLYHRSVVIGIKSKGHPSLMDVLKRSKTRLELTQTDLDAVWDLETSSDQAFYTVPDIDDELSTLLPE